MFIIKMFKYINLNILFFKSYNMIKKLVFLLLLTIWIINYCSAAEVTNSWLLLEYKFQWNYLDTSWNNNYTTYTWVTLNYDSKQDVNYATIWTWRIATNLGWSTDEYGKYTISLWYKWTTNANNYKQVIISSNNTDFFYTNNSTWTIFWQNISFSNYLDNKWHNIIIRKNWKYNKVYIDWKLVVDYQWLVWALSYNLTFWWYLNSSLVNWLSYYYSINWSILWIRVYNRELNLEEMSALYNEYNYLYNSSLDDYEYIVSPSIWSNMLWSWTYSVSFWVKTPLSWRINPANIVYNNSRWNDYPQTIFSTISNNKEKLNFVLTNNYYCSTPYWNFDCGVLRDQNKHIFLIRKNASTFDIFIDWNKVFTKTASWSLWSIGSVLSTYNSTVTIPNMWYWTFWSSVYCSSWFDQNWVFICNSKNAFSWELTNLNIYNWFMTDKQLNSFFIQEWYNVQNNLNWVLKWYLNNLLNIEISWIQNQDKKENTNYEYSFDNTSFTRINSWSLIEQVWSSWSLVYQYSLDVSWQPDWNWNLFLRTNSWWIIKFIAKIGFIKETNYDIIINEPSTSEETSKNISATFSRWSLYMSITRWTTCWASLTFENYSPLIFNSPKDNWIKICYKWVDSVTWKAYYKLSKPLEWIVSNISYLWWDSFEYYTSWKFSPNIKNNDSTFLMLSLLANWSYSTSSSQTSWSSMVDINWDWLIDLLYMSNIYWYTNSNIAIIWSKRLIMVNNWDYTFNTVYKCANFWDWSYSPNWTPVLKWYFWDCAWNIDLWD